MAYSRRTLMAAGFPAVMLAQNTPPSDQVRIAFIGVGTRGSHLHRTMLRVPGAKIVAIADLDSERAGAAAAAAREAGHDPGVYTDYRKMLSERKDIDAIVVATPVDTHVGLAIATLESGASVYLEKPVALNLAECDTVKKATLSAKGILQIGFQLRHDPNRSAAVEFIQAGKAGKVIYLQGYRHTGDLPRETAWLFDRKRSGDIIVEQACHILDLMIWVAGSPPDRCFGSGGISLYHDVPPGRTIMDNYSMIYEWTSGLRLNFSQIYFDPSGFSGTKERVFGSEGAVDLPTATFYPLGRREQIKIRGDVPVEPPPPPGTPRRDDASFHSLSAFLDNARAKKKPLNNIDSARISTLVAVMGRTSIYEKRLVTWNEIVKG